jgi:hypothetical protein
MRPTTLSIYVRSEEVLSREIGGDLMLVSLAEAVADIEDGLFALNETGREIWASLDGKKTLGDIAAYLAEEFDVPVREIERDVAGLAGELFKRKMIVEVTPHDAQDK